MAGPTPSAHSSRTVPAFVEKGKIIDVDIETYTVTVVTEMTKMSFYGVPFATPYQHYANGEGIYFMPEVGSIAWLCWPSDGPDRPFILGWTAAREDNGSLRAKKAQLNPGDIYLGTRDENFLVLRRGGVVQVGGGPICQRIFMPVNNLISDYCENYGLHTLAGDLEWSIYRPETTVDGKRPGLFALKAREFANDKAPIAVLEIGSNQGGCDENGSHGENSQNILSLAIRGAGTDSAETRISLQFRKDGSASWEFQKDVDWSVQGKLTVTVEEALSLTSNTAKALFKGKTVEVAATGGNVKVASTTTVDVTAGTSVNVGPSVNLGVAPGAGGAGGLTAVLLADPAFLAWLTGHTHKVISVGAPTGPASDDPLYPAVKAEKYTASKTKAK